MTQFRHFHVYEGEDVVLEAPTGVRAIRVDPISPNPTLPKTDKFRPIRHVINFKIIDENTYEILKEIETPLNFWIRYRQSDYAQAHGLSRELALAYWDGSEWVRLDYELIPTVPGHPEFGGYAFFVTETLSDPQVSWGV